jgi:hypothetical protein
VAGRRKCVHDSPGHGFGLSNWRMHSNPLDRGLGQKPRCVAVSPFILYGWSSRLYTELTKYISVLQQPAGAVKQEASNSLHFQNGAGAIVVIPTNSHRSTPRRILKPPSQCRSPKGAAADDAFIPPLEADSVAVVDTVNARISESEAATWAASLLPLVKGCWIRPR